jgi:hypothetical protein
MVNIQHILQGSLSNSATAVGVFEEDMSCVGLGKVLWGKAVAGLLSSRPVAVIVTDPRSVQYVPALEIVPYESQWQLKESSVIVDAVPRVGRAMPSLQLALAGKPVFIDSLEVLGLACPDLKTELSALVSLERTG